MAVISLEDVNRIIAENDPTHREAERQVRQVQERQQASDNQADLPLRRQPPRAVPQFVSCRSVGNVLQCIA